MLDDESDNISNYKIDFSSCIMLEKEAYYVFITNFDKSRYLRIKKQSLKNIREILNKKKRNNTPNAYTESIIKFANTEYFVIFSTFQNKYYCILYNDNYQFDQIKVFSKSDVKYIKQLPNYEILSILELIRKNIGVLGNEDIQNRIYMKILELK